MSALVLFTASGRTFALPAACVAQVLRMAAPAPVAGAPPWLRGVLNVHGELLPVVDVAARLGLSRTPMSPQRQLVVVEADGRRIALEVDEVLEVREVGEEAFLPRGRFAPSAPLVAGAARIEDAVVLVQDVAAWLAAGEAAAGAAP
jgi:chemotaxis signal transduction protein